jgi:hypothetical protein
MNIFEFLNESSEFPLFLMGKFALIYECFRGPLSLVSTTEELLGRKSSGSGLENREYGRRDPVTLTTWHPLSAKAGNQSLRRQAAVAQSV